jgi:hypothetical protein
VETWRARRNNDLYRRVLAEGGFTPPFNRPYHRKRSNRKRSTRNRSTRKRSTRKRNN